MNKLNHYLFSISFGTLLLKLNIFNFILIILFTALINQFIDFFHGSIEKAEKEGRYFYCITASFYFKLCHKIFWILILIPYGTHILLDLKFQKIILLFLTLNFKKLCTYVKSGDNMLWVIGHKNPDTDSIVSAMVYARKINAKPSRAGEINPETEFVLEKFGVEKPELKEKIEKNEKVILVDTNNREELIPIEGEIVEIIDHHRLFGNLSTAKPIKVCIEPVGSTSTLIAERFLNSLTKEEAGLLLSGILSDTVVFKSPTATEKDKQIAKKLAEIAGIEDIESYGIELKSKAAKLSENPKENILRDFKVTEAGGKKFGIGQVEIIGYEKVMKKKEEYLKAMEEIRNEKNLDYVLFMVTDIIEEGTKLLIAGKDKEKVAKAFEKELKDSYIDLPGVMSRKKQVMPVIQEKFG